MKIIKYTTLIVLLTSLFACDSFLDRQPDEALNEDKIFAKRATTENYLYHVYSYIPQEWNTADPDHAGWIPASDEASYSTDRGFRRMNNGAWNTNDVPYAKWESYYRAIREASYFMSKVNICPELTGDEKIQYKAEARFLRGYYYYLLIRMYGPVILTGDEVIDISQPDMNMPRNTWDECVKYICDEMDSAANILPVSQVEMWYGKATKAAALAVKALTKVTDASPLFNNKDRSKYLYADVKNSDGTPIFPQSYDPNKWADAAKYAKDVINLSEYQLYEVYNAGTIDPYKSIMGVHTVNWNKEIIFARNVSASWWFAHTVPRGTNTYGVYSPSQNLVDGFAMANGKYPISGYDDNGNPTIDETSGYVETKFTNFTHPVNLRNQTTSTYNMYCNREPRFYTNIMWNRMGYPFPSARTRIQFYANSNSGPGVSHDYPNGGYLIRKAVRNEINPENSQWDIKFSWSLIRLAEIYLIYTEALIESNPADADVFKYWNMVRKRAGLKDIQDVYPDAVGNQDLMRELLRNERKVELCFESRRFFDTRRWQIAEQTDGGHIYRMNIYAKSDGDNSDYWKRDIAEKRVFEKKHYLYPLALAEVERNKSLVQNFEW